MDHIGRKEQTATTPPRHIEKTPPSTPASDNTAVGYLHNLSPVKESEKKNSYFDMKLQTQKRTYRAVCFASNLHDEFNSRYESSSPIKINNCQIRVNPRSNYEEIHINKRSRIEDPYDHEVQFDIDSSQREQKYQAIKIPLSEIKNMKPGTQLDVAGRITFQGNFEMVNVRGNKIRMQEAVLTDESGSTRLVLWEADISKVESGRTYDLKRAVVKEFNNKNYISLNRQTEIKESQQTIERIDEKLGNCSEQVLPCPPEGVQSLHRYLCCKKCSKFIVNSEKNVVKCTNTSCGLSQLKSTCETQVQANAFFVKNDGTKLSILLRQDTLEKLFRVYNSEVHVKRHLCFQELTDDDIVEVILSVSEACIVYGKNNVAQDILPKSTNLRTDVKEPEQDIKQPDNETGQISTDVPTSSMNENDLMKDDIDEELLLKSVDLEEQQQGIKQPNNETGQISMDVPLSSINEDDLLKDDVDEELLLKSVDLEQQQQDIKQPDNETGQTSRDVPPSSVNEDDLLSSDLDKDMIELEKPSTQGNLDKIWKDLKNVFQNDSVTK